MRLKLIMFANLHTWSIDRMEHMCAAAVDYVGYSSRLLVIPWAWMDDPLCTAGGKKRSMCGELSVSVYSATNQPPPFGTNRESHSRWPAVYLHTQARTYDSGAATQHTSISLRTCG